MTDPALQRRATRARPGSKADAERGVALVIVLWVIAFLALILSVFAAGTRADLHIARNRLAAVEAQAAADAGVALALSGVADAAFRAARMPGSTSASAWTADGTTHELVWEGTDLRVRVDSESGKIDLNVAPQEIFIGLFLALGAEPAQAADLGAAIFAWRAARAEALGATQLHPPQRIADQPPGPFLALEELHLVPGMTSEAYTLVAPYVTVWANRAWPDPRTASRIALLSLPGANPARIDAWLAVRADQGPTAQIPPDLVPAIALTNLARPVVTVRCEATTRAGARFVRSVAAAVTGNPEEPVRILAWEGSRSTEPEGSAAGR
jgi:general secretion pathway protein K